MNNDLNQFRPLQLNFDADHLSHGLFLAKAFEAGHSHFNTARWRTGIADIEELADDANASAVTERSDALVVEVGGCLAHVILQDGHVFVHLAAGDRGSARAALEVLRRLYPEFDADEDGGTVPMTFWWRNRFGQSGQRSRELTVPTWAEIEANYEATTRSAVDDLMSRVGVEGSGDRTILWHGPPGTGKTFALRALAREWREWCDVQVVTDPETLLGESPDYLLEVLTRDDGARSNFDRWQLLVLEDTGELLVADAHERIGQGLSRFLNVVDGLLGQGLRTIFLVTTNEDLRRLHPAVSRPGRCLGSVEFKALSTIEANAWLAERSEQRVDGGSTLAELFSIAGGAEPQVSRKVGFRLPDEEAA